jgi:hypothetical protein
MASNIQEFRPAAAVRSNRSAVRRRRCAESRAASTSRPAMLPGQWQKPKHSSSLAVIESASRCCSPISSAYSGSAGCAYWGRGAPSSSSRWLLSLRTSGGSPRFWCGRRRRLHSVAQVPCSPTHRKQLSASGAADRRPPHQQPVLAAAPSSSPTSATKSAFFGHG